MAYSSLQSEFPDTREDVLELISLRPCEEQLHFGELLANPGECFHQTFMVLVRPELGRIEDELLGNVEACPQGLELRLLDI